MHRSILLAMALAAAFATTCGDSGSTCGDGIGNGGSTLGAQASALVTDSAEASDSEEAVETLIEEPLSGAEPAEAGGSLAPSESGDPDVIIKNASRFFKPQGCLVSTASAGVVTHVFKDCTGPHGLSNFSGTITSTWSRNGNTVSVTHEASGFQVNGSTVDLSVTIDYSFCQAVITSHRVANTTVRTQAGKTISNQSDYTTTYDTAEHCTMRNGNSQAAVDGRSLSRAVEGFRRCGTDAAGCPRSGTCTITRGDLTLTLTFPGGASMVVTRPDGVSVTLPLECDETAS